MLTEKFRGQKFAIALSRSPIFVGILGLIAGIGAAFVTGWFNQQTGTSVETTRVGGQLDLERLKFQTSLILKAIDTPDQEVAIKTLKFFANAGLIPAYERKIIELTSIDQGRGIPTTSLKYRQLSELSDQKLLQIARGVGKLKFKFGAIEAFCTAFLLKRNLAVSSSACDRKGADSRVLVLGDGDREGPKTYNVLDNTPTEGKSGVFAFNVEGDPSTLFGVVPLVLREPKIGERIALIHVISAGVVRVSMDGCFVLSVDPTDTFGLKFYCNFEAGAGGALVVGLSDYATLGVYGAPEVGKGDVVIPNIGTAALLQRAANLESFLK